MASPTVKNKCSICEEMTTFVCRGCLKDFCFDHLAEHRQLLNKQLEVIQNDFNQFRQKMIDLRDGSNKHPLIEQIDCWEQNSIMKIKEKAEECRQLVIDHTNRMILRAETYFKKTNEEFFFTNKPNKNISEID